VPVANYNWDDNGDIVKVRVNLEGESLMQEDAKVRQQHTLPFWCR